MTSGCWAMSNGAFASLTIFLKTVSRRSMFISPTWSPIRAWCPSIPRAGIIHVWVSNKVPYNTKHSLAEAIGVPAEKIVIHVSAIGGDFGGKGALMDLPLCYFLAQRLNRPVRMIMTYTEELMAGNPRHAAQIVVKTGVKKDGQFMARQIKVYWNGGAYGAMKPIPIGQFAGRRQSRRLLSHPQCQNRFLRDLHQQCSLRPFSLAGISATGLRRRIADRYDCRSFEDRPAGAPAAQRAQRWRPDTGPERHGGC